MLLFNSRKVGITMASPFQIFSIGAILAFFGSLFVNNKKDKAKKDSRDRDFESPEGSNRDFVDVPASPDNNFDDNNDDDDRVDTVRDGAG